MRPFLSDNTASVHPKILDAIHSAGSSGATPYVDENWTSALDKTFSELFEKDVSVIPCITGTAANALSLSMLCTPINAVLTAHDSHIYVDECNAIEFFTGGARQTPVFCPSGKLDPSDLQSYMSRKGDFHAAQPSAISVSQINETGLLYSLEELSELGKFCRETHLYFHLDGARFANAVASLQCTAAEASWKCGVDIMSFGGTKNGCFAAEAIIVFNPEIAKDIKYRLKRSGHFLSRAHLLNAQLQAFLSDGLWLDCARDANKMSMKLFNRVRAVDGVNICKPPAANMFFVQLEDQLLKHTRIDLLPGYLYDNNMMRLCTSWATTNDDVFNFSMQLE